MHAMMPLLKKTDFPAIRRSHLEILQVNLGYKCNQACLHCHVNAGPTRTEMMSLEIINTILDVLQKMQITRLDITGGAPEMNPHFCKLVQAARRAGIYVIDRCNLTILEEPGYEFLADFLAQNRVEVIASLPCYLEANVNQQRGTGVFEKSIHAIRKLNTLGYGCLGSDLQLNLVYNPVGPHLPPPQAALEADYKRELKTRYDIEFNRLFTLTNMPIARFGSTLVSKNLFEGYMQRLKDAYQPANLASVMCRNLISVDYQGYLYDCDFNQMLGIPLNATPQLRPHIRDLLTQTFAGNRIAVADHCYGCTAGQGSSCGGALN